MCECNELQGGNDGNDELYLNSNESHSNNPQDSLSAPVYWKHF